MKLQKDEVVKKIGIKLREIRLEKKLTIEKVALESEIEYTQLSRIELGKINTSVYQIYKISHTLSVPVPEIFQSLYY
jgi:transcriptional regulator with XRE-family HTH domain